MLWENILARTMINDAHDIIADTAEYSVVKTSIVRFEYVQW